MYNENKKAEKLKRFIKYNCEHISFRDTSRHAPKKLPVTASQGEQVQTKMTYP